MKIYARRLRNVTNKNRTSATEKLLLPSAEKQGIHPSASRRDVAGVPFDESILPVFSSTTKNNFQYVCSPDDDDDDNDVALAFSVVVCVYVSLN